jgi:choline dehydrogenase-like flavoprotein
MRPGRRIARPPGTLGARLARPGKKVSVLTARHHHGPGRRHHRIPATFMLNNGAYRSPRFMLETSRLLGASSGRTSRSPSARSWPSRWACRGAA